ncbi:MAG: SAM-dependent methyltransferase [Bacteroidetes bacterium HGW-Bacteroidetes-12]|nr:MAG: SAM-dependent methyltransferase [Bacteroidetes bacterium HGW-Bacteroidetes-12]
MIKKNENWFEEWFDSTYYHLLYKNRDEHEAELFISNLIAYLNPSKNEIFLDVACGKGRHAIYMNKLGYKVDAFDLSDNSIAFAKKFENKQLNFFVNDIRNSLKLNYYDVAFNLFTSFGYFVDDKDNQQAIDAIAKSLKKGGRFVLDFMNAKKVIKTLQPVEEKKIKHINFLIEKKVVNNFIVKEISFNDKGKDFKFIEQVKTIFHEDFLAYFEAASLNIEAVFGDYNLNAFNEDTSDRLILVATKTNNT